MERENIKKHEQPHQSCLLFVIVEKGLGPMGSYSLCSLWDGGHCHGQDRILIEIRSGKKLENVEGKNIK